ncbi:MAG: hypothetical protein ACRDVK_08155 [Acidimicrobiia bacterium]
MTSTRSCNGGHHNYVTAGSRSKCSRCGAVQVDLTGTRAELEVDQTKVFGARRPTLFSLKLEKTEPGVEAGFGKARHRR